MKILIFLIMSSACKRNYKDVIGKYIANHSIGSEFIVLQGNGHFLHQIDLDSIHNINSGTWKFESSADGDRIILYNYRYFIDFYEGKYKPTNGGVADVIWRKNAIIFYPFGDEFNFFKEKDAKNSDNK